MREPVHVASAFDSARAGLTMNNTVQTMTHTPASARHVMDHIQDVMGIHKLTPMTHSSTESMMSLVFYAGDGIVLKVGSSDYVPDAGPFEVPPITQDRVSGYDRLVDRYYDMNITTYPFLARPVSQQQINAFEQEQLIPIGLKISPNDKHPRNFRAAPDQKGTVLSIDTGSFMPAYNGKIPDPELKNEFFAYMHLLFPAYTEREIKPQTDLTSFDPFSPFDRRHNVAGFDVRRCLEAGDSAIELAHLHNITTPEKPIRPLWQRLFLPFGNTEGTVKADIPDGSEPI